MVFRERDDAEEARLAGKTRGTLEEERGAQEEAAAVLQRALAAPHGMPACRTVCLFLLPPPPSCLTFFPSFPSPSPPLPLPILTLLGDCRRVNPHKHAHARTRRHTRTLPCRVPWPARYDSKEGNNRELGPLQPRTRPFATTNSALCNHCSLTPAAVLGEEGSRRRARILHSLDADDDVDPWGRGGDEAAAVVAAARLHSHGGADVAHPGAGRQLAALAAQRVSGVWVACARRERGV